MAEVLLITTTDIKRNSVVSGSVDVDKFVQYLKIAQDIHIQQYLGTDLLVAIQGKIQDGTIDDVGNANYKNLLIKYVKPMLIYWALVEYYPFAAYTVSNGGVYKHTSETSETVNKDEVDFLIEKARATAQNYTRRFIDYICNNTTLFPEYLSNSNEDVSPSGDGNFGGWVL